MKYGLYTLPHFTVGIPFENSIKELCIVHPIHCDKEYSLKERLLYYINDNDYYTSQSKHYIVFTRKLLFFNLTYIVNLIKLLNMTIILPDDICTYPNCMHEIYPSYGDKLLIKYLEKEKVDYRESTFFRHPLVPNNIKKLYISNINELYNIISNLYNNTIL